MSGIGGGVTQQGSQGTFNQQGVQPGMQSGMQVGRQGTGASDPTYDLISVVYHCLKGASAGGTYIQDAQGDQELTTCFQDFVKYNQQMATKCQQLLARRLSTSTTRG